MGGCCLAERLGRYVNLTQAEQDALARLEEPDRPVRRGTIVLSEGAPSRELYVVRHGWLQSSVLLDNGGRQIMRIILPGDVIGLASLAFDESPETVKALTDAAICPVDREGIAPLFTDHPRLAALILSLAMAERTALADRLASIGRTSARARVAALLCEIFSRLGQDGEMASSGIHLPLTQEEIGDATGLTAVHVNRMIRGLEDERMIERSGNVVRLLNAERLRSAANFVDRSRIATHWLPRAN